MSVFKWADLIAGKTIEQAGTLLEPARDVVRVVAFSPDGRQVAGGHAAIHIWDVQSGRTIKKLWAGAIGRHRVCRVLKYSHDGTYLAVGNYERYVRLFDARTYEHLRYLQGRDPLHSVDFTPDGRLLAAGFEHKLVDVFRAVEVWDTKSGKPVPDDNATNPVPNISLQSQRTSVSFSTDGKLLAAGGHEKVVVWSVADQQRLFHLDHPAHLFAKYVEVLFSPDGKWLVTCTGPTIHFWDTAPMMKLLPRKKK